MAQKINLSAGCSRPRRQLGSILRITLALCICLTLCEAAPEPAKPSCSSPGESCTTASAAATPQYSKHHGDGYGSHKSFRKCLKSISGDPSSPEVVFPGDQDYTASIGYGTGRVGVGHCKQHLHCLLMSLGCPCSHNRIVVVHNHLNFRSDLQ